MREEMNMRTFFWTALAFIAVAAIALLLQPLIDIH